MGTRSTSDTLSHIGTAGYGNQSWAIGQSYADKPVLTPVLYDPSAPKGQKWSSDGLGSSTIPRMYHSSATLLPDGKLSYLLSASRLTKYGFISASAGSIFVAGSNPNSDHNVGAGIKYPTEYRAEKFYPSYYNERRPQPVGLLSKLGYGGAAFDVALGSDDLFGDVNNVVNTTVVLVRTGFSTHSMVSCILLFVWV